MQLKSPENSAMFLQLAAERNTLQLVEEWNTLQLAVEKDILAVEKNTTTPNKVVELTASKKTSPSELLKLISSKVIPGKVRKFQF